MCYLRHKYGDGRDAIRRSSEQPQCVCCWEPRLSGISGSQVGTTPNSRRHREIFAVRPRRWRHRAASLHVRSPRRRRFCWHRKRYAFERSIRFRPGGSTWMVSTTTCSSTSTSFPQSAISPLPSSRKRYRLRLPTRRSSRRGSPRLAGLLCRLRPVAQLPDWRRLPQSTRALEHSCPVSRAMGFSIIMQSRLAATPGCTLTGLSLPRSAPSV